MRILYLTPQIPYPLYGGSHIRNFNLIRQLAHRHQITLLSFSPQDELSSGGPMADWGVNIETVASPPKIRPGVRAVLSYLSPDLRSFYARFSPEMVSLVKAQLEAGAVDALVAFGASMGTYAALGRDAAGLQRLQLVLDEPVLRPRVVAQVIRQQGAALKKLPLWVGWKQLLYFVSQVVGRSTLCTVAGVQDELEMRRLMPGYRGTIAQVPNGVDTLEFNVSPVAPSPFKAVFNGALTLYNNFDAMRYFLRDIFPLIAKEEPRVRLQITGGTGGVKLDSLMLCEGATVTGYVEDVRPYVAQSRVCVVPLRVGAGTRLKILEAMALGTPVVSTSKGAEGLDVTHGKDILLADEPATFARMALSVIEDQALHDRLAANARRLVEEKYDWRIVGRTIEELLLDLVDGGAGRRLPAAVRP